MTNITEDKFFVAGGSLKLSDASYIVRSADEKLAQLLLQGHYCNVLTSRQVGKSSLVVRTREELKKHEVRTAFVDISHRGQGITPSEWYLGLVDDLNDINNGLALEVDINHWWEEQQEHSPIDRFTMFIEKVVLTQIPDKQIVIIIDEIDTTITLDFTDDFFIAIRSFYNQRAVNPEFNRLSFVLVGAVHPSELIKNRRRTPYNIGEYIELTDFKLEQLASFSRILESHFPGQGEEIVRWVLDWTGGQPYLTQKLCAEIIKAGNQSLTEDTVADYAKALFLSDEIRKDEHFNNIKNRINSSHRKYQVLNIYKQVFRGKLVRDEVLSPAINELKLLGLVSFSQEGFESRLILRNKVYKELFNEHWIKENTRFDTMRWMILTLSLVTLIAAGISIALYLRQKNLTIETQAQAYIDSFNSSVSAEVRITNLASLINLGEKYATQSHDIFQNLPYSEKRNLFTIPQPQNVGAALVTVAKETYQNIPDTSEGNELLNQMAQELNQLTDIQDALNIATEIKLWLHGRELAKEGKYSEAIEQFDNAIRLSEGRKQPNAGIMYDRALSNLSLGNFHAVLVDFSAVVEKNPLQTESIVSQIVNSPALYSYWVTKREEFSSFDKYLSTPTPQPTLTSSLTKTFSGFSLAQEKTPTFTPMILTTPIPELANITSENANKIQVVSRWNSGIIYDLEYSPDGDLLALSSPSGITIYNSSTKNIIIKINTNAGIFGIDFSPDGTLLAAGSVDKSVTIWKVNDGSLLREMQGHTWNVVKVDFSPDGKFLASASADDTIRIWDVESGVSVRQINAQMGNVNDLAYSPDGEWLAAAYAQKAIIIWNINDMNLKKIYTGFLDEAYTLGFSPDGALLATGSFDQTVRLRDIKNDKLVWSKDINDNIHQIVFSKDGSYLVTGTGSGVIQFWNVENGEILKDLHKHTAAIEALAIHPNGEMLASAARDGKVIFWRIPNGDEESEWKISDPTIGKIRFSDQSTIITLEDDRYLRTRRASDGGYINSWAYWFDNEWFGGWDLSQDGSIFAFADSRYGYVFIYRTIDGHRLNTIKDPAINIYRL